MLLEWCLGIFFKNLIVFKMDMLKVNVERLVIYYVNLMNKL